MEELRLEDRQRVGQGPPPARLHHARDAACARDAERPCSQACACHQQRSHGGTRRLKRRISVGAPDAGTWPVSHRLLSALPSPQPHAIFSPPRPLHAAATAPCSSERVWDGAAWLGPDGRSRRSGSLSTQLAAPARSERVHRRCVVAQRGSAREGHPHRREARTKSSAHASHLLLSRVPLIHSKHLKRTLLERGRPSSVPCRHVVP